MLLRDSFVGIREILVNTSVDITSIIIWIFAVIFVSAGLIGLVLPAIPGTPLLFLGLLLAAWAENFLYVSGGTIAILAILAIISYSIDLLAGALGAKKFGASRRASFGAALGALVGLFFGFIGVLIGPFIGAFIGELTNRIELNPAARAGFGAWLGFLLGIAAKVALGFTMIGVFILARFL